MLLDPAMPSSARMHRHSLDTLAELLLATPGAGNVSAARRCLAAALFGRLAHGGLGHAKHTVAPRPYPTPRHAHTHTHTNCSTFTQPAFPPCMSSRPCWSLHAPFAAGLSHHHRRPIPAATPGRQRSWRRRQRGAAAPSGYGAAQHRRRRRGGRQAGRRGTHAERHARRSQVRAQFGSRLCPVEHSAAGARQPRSNAACSKHAPGVMLRNAVLYQPALPASIASLVSIVSEHCQPALSVSQHCQPALPYQPRPPGSPHPLQGHAQHHGPGRFLLRPYEHRGHPRYCQLYGDGGGRRRAGAACASAGAHHRGSPCQQHGGPGGSADGGAGGGVGGLPRRETRGGQRAGKVVAARAARPRSAKQGWELLWCGWVVADVCMHGLKALWPAHGHLIGALGATSTMRPPRLFRWWTVSQHASCLYPGCAGFNGGPRPS